MADLGVVDEPLSPPRELDAVAKPLTAPHLVETGPALSAVPDAASG
jgi:hypothetical protein